MYAGNSRKQLSRTKKSNRIKNGNQRRLYHRINRIKHNNNYLCPKQGIEGRCSKVEIKLNYSLKKADDTKSIQKEEKGQVIDFKELMDKIVLQLATLKISTHLNMQRLGEEHDKELNNSKDNGTKGTI